ncbi:P-loop containing nucleoside triphosphate hydrolase protein [Geopyxis carbonaria]|nr:P-loop containing nucleoside triphosphate hydrolase protein [Geopyxis carbonaria]
MLTYPESVGSLVSSTTSTTTSSHAMGKAQSSLPRSINNQHIWIITGPAGCGKSSVALHLAKKLNLPYIEGDDYHPEANIEKMANGIPLTDDDRWDWLETIRNQAVHELEGGAAGCVVTCSCLKRKYRDVIRLASRDAEDVVVRFVYLQASEELLLSRVKARANHYMKDDMVKSQFEALEEPDNTEKDVIVVDVSGPLQGVFDVAMEKVHECMETE